MCRSICSVININVIPMVEKELSHNRDSTKEYPVRYYLFLKDRKNFPFNFTLHKVMMSDESYYIVLELGCFDTKRWLLGTHTPEGKFWRGPGSIRFRKAEDPHYLELASKMKMAMKFLVGVYFLWVKKSRR